MLPSGSRVICVLLEVFLGLDLYSTDPAKCLVTAEDLSDLSDLADLSD